MPPSSTFGLTSAPSRYLFFAREEEERLGSAYSKESDMTMEKQSTMNGNGLVQGIPIAFQNDNNQGDVIETFRKVQDNHESTA